MGGPSVTKTTYDIQRRDHGVWHGDIGESAGWPSVTAAVAAVESLRQLGPDWHGEYRILDSTTRKVVLSTLTLE